MEFSPELRERVDEATLADMVESRRRALEASHSGERYDTHIQWTGGKSAQGQREAYVFLIDEHSRRATMRTIRRLLEDSQHPEFNWPEATALMLKIRQQTGVALSTNRRISLAEKGSRV